MTNVAVIPARSGSKRIPHKNIIVIDDRPLIAHVIDMIRQTQLFDEIVVSTDSEEIMEIVTDLGATAPFFRPPNLSDDFAKTIDVLRHATNELSLNDFDDVCCIYPTAIMTQPDSLCASLTRLTSSSAQFCMPITKFQSHPLRGFSFSDDAFSITPFFPENTETRTQDIAPMFFDAGQYYWAKAKAWRESDSVHRNAIGFEVPWWQAIDLDEPEDLEKLKFAYQYFIKGKYHG